MPQKTRACATIEQPKAVSGTLALTRDLKRGFPLAVRQSGRMAAGCLIGLMLFSGHASAQAPREYSIPAEKMTCLVENQDKYLGLPRAIIMFSPDLCPAIGNEEVAGLALNSADAGAMSERWLMTKTDFSCLVTEIAAHLSEEEATPSQEGERVIFQLNCP